MNTIARLSTGLAELLHGPRMGFREAFNLVLDDIMLGGLGHDAGMAAARANPALTEAFSVLEAEKAKPDPWVTGGHERDERRADPWMEPGEWDDEEDGE